MNRNYILAIFISLLTTNCFSQCDYSNYKTLTDTTFQINDKIICPSIVYVQPGSSRLLMERTQDALDMIGEFMMKYKKLKFELGVYTEHLGSAKFNLIISEQRAQVIKNYLVTTHHIDGNRIINKGYGKLTLFTLKKLFLRIKLLTKKQFYTTVIEERY